MPQSVPHPTDTDAAETEPGRLVENLMFFARTLRAAGLPLGPGRVLEGLRAMQAVGIERRDDLYWALHAVFVNRRQEQPLFDQAFHVFWRNPRLLDRMMSLVLPTTPDETAAQEQLARRLAEAMREDGGLAQTETEEVEYEFDAAVTWSDQETLRTQDFEQMSRAELDAAKRAIARLRLPVQRVKTRRHRASRTPGRADLRRSMRAALRGGHGTMIPLRYTRPRTRVPPLVVLCDVSGSMAQYSRMPPWRRSGNRSPTGRAARASAPACTRSTATGRAASSARAPWFCSFPTAWTGTTPTGWRARWSGCTSRAGA